PCPPPSSTLCPYTTLFRSRRGDPKRHLQPLFHYRKPDPRLTKASAGRARRLEICTHLLSTNRKRRTRPLLFSITSHRISTLGRLKHELKSSSSCPTGRK